MFSSHNICKSKHECKKIPWFTCSTDYDEGPLEQERETELSEDTDCDGSSLPEDSPEVQFTSYFGRNQTYVSNIEIFFHDSPITEFTES